MCGKYALEAVGTTLFRQTWCTGRPAVSAPTTGLAASLHAIQTPPLSARACEVMLLYYACYTVKLPPLLDILLTPS